MENLAGLAEIVGPIGVLVVVVAWAATDSGNQIVVGGEANDSGAFMMSAPIGFDCGNHGRFRGSEIIFF